MTVFIIIKNHSLKIINIQNTLLLKNEHQMKNKLPTFTTCFNSKLRIKIRTILGYLSNIASENRRAVLVSDVFVCLYLVFEPQNDGTRFSPLFSSNWAPCATYPFSSLKVVHSYSFTNLARFSTHKLFILRFCIHILFIIQFMYESW